MQLSLMRMLLCYSAVVKLFSQMLTRMKSMDVTIAAENAAMLFASNTVQSDVDQNEQMLMKPSLLKMLL